MSLRFATFGVALLLVAALCVPGTAMAGTITAAQVSADLTTVETDIAHNPLKYVQSTLAQADLNAGIAAMTAGDVAAAMGNNSAAQTDFANAIKDFNGILSVLGDAPLDPPGSGVPEPASVLLLGIGMMALAAARGMKNHQVRRQIAA